MTDVTRRAQLIADVRAAYRGEQQARHKARVETVKRIEAARKARVSVQELADALGLSRQAVYKMIDS